MYFQCKKECCIVVLEMEGGKGGCIDLGCRRVTIMVEKCAVGLWRETLKGKGREYSVWWSEHHASDV